MAKSTDSSGGVAEKVCCLCGRPASKVPLLDVRQGVVCRYCLLHGLTVLKAQRAEAQKVASAATTAIQIPPAKAIKAFLDQYVIGQDHAKKVLSVAVHNHYSRITRATAGQSGPMPDVELDKSNVLLIGPTGTGKTLLAQTLARMLDVPFAISDATTLTEAGYVGDDVENVLLRLYQAADGNLARAERGICYIDEIDKTAKRDTGLSVTRDVSGEGVQQGLLKIIEGTVSNVSLNGGRKHPGGDVIQLNTRNILFICGGAFVGLDTIAARRVKGKGLLGFGDLAAAETRSVERIQPEDLVAFGMIPEFVGRLPVVSVLNTLSEDDLMQILSEPRNSIIRQFEKLMLLDGAKLIVEEDSKHEMARIAVSRGTGARGLRALLEETMLDMMFEVTPGSTVTVTPTLIARANRLDKVA